LYDGLDVWTTLDPKLQHAAEHIVKTQIGQLGAYHVTDGALVSEDLRQHIDVHDGLGPTCCYGFIRAMVGSADYHNVAISGQINMADRPRQPGSSFKPFNYILGFENGLAPATTVLDAPLAIPDAGNPRTAAGTSRGIMTLAGMGR
jgi:membrane carboxypeptidase/penicillin-binding protein PbpC